MFDNMTATDVALILTAISGLVGAYWTYRLGLRQTAKDEKTDAQTAQNAEDANALSLIEKAFAISEGLQSTLKKDLDDLRQQIKDTQSLVSLLSEENRKLLIENDKLMRANHMLTEENNVILRENKKLSEEIVTLTGRISTLEDAIKAPSELLGAIDHGSTET